jgi:nitroreductase
MNPKLTVEGLKSRRSIRQYTDEPVTDDQVKQILEAAMAAPSAGNRKPWHFIVVRDTELRARIAEAHPHARMVRQAPVCIVPCGQPSLSFADRSAFWIQDLSAATENILLAAKALGLGSVWCGVHPVEERVREAREILGIPEDVIALCYIAIGHGAEDKEPRTQYEEDRVHHDRW